MEVAPFFVDFHHFLSIFTIFCRFSPFFCRFSRFTHFCRDLHSVEIYALFPPIFLAKIAIPATSHVFSMYGSSYVEQLNHQCVARTLNQCTVASLCDIVLCRTERIKRTFYGHHFSLFSQCVIIQNQQYIIQSFGM